MDPFAGPTIVSAVLALRRKPLSVIRLPIVICVLKRSERTRGRNELRSRRAAYFVSNNVWTLFFVSRFALTHEMQ